MTKVEYQTQINAPVQRVYEYYTNPNNIQEAWPQDIVKESEDVSGSGNEEGSEMRLQVVDKEENRKLLTKQIQGPFKKWDSIQEFQGNGTNTTQIKHSS
jgi:ligand-binding SRPBCC domain-containing protein